jgi:acyl-CoA reductase-like NAD-dependent aldehyde dehydrogenase
VSLRLVDSLEDRLERALAIAASFQALGAERRIELLLAAKERLESSMEAHVDELARTSGLRSANVRWGLSTTFEAVTREALTSIVRSAQSAGPKGSIMRPRGLHALILSGNVFTAALRALYVPLCLGNPVIAKASPRNDLFAHLLARALVETDPIFRDAVAVVTFSSRESDLVELLLERCHTVAAYGSDETIRALRRRLGAGVRFLPHGHGLGLAYVEGDGTDDEVAAFADDVIAYDQRGCLSPHALIITGDARAFAARLQKALAAASFRRPRGSLPMDVGAAQVQWRGVAHARGELFEGLDFAIAVESASRPRLSPGYRNVSILSIDNREAFGALAGSFGAHLKAVGVGGMQPSELSLRLGCVPRVCALGEMQRPPLEAAWEGAPAHEGLVAY